MYINFNVYMYMMYPANINMYSSVFINIMYNELYFSLNY